MTTQVQGATFRYTHTIGRGEEAGTGFKNPVAVARGADNVMYVISRAYDYRADSKRITVCTVDEEYIGEIGNGGRLGGELMDTGEFAVAGALPAELCQEFPVFGELLNAIVAGIHQIDVIFAINGDSRRLVDFTIARSDNPP